MGHHEYFLEDSYCKELESKVVEISKNGIKLEEVIFYPQGGGQPDDRGNVVHDGNTYKVQKIHRQKDGVYLQIGENIERIEIGDSIIQRIDWDYRYQLMKHHTALHILSAVVWDKYDAKVTGGTIYHNKARLDFDLDEFGQELAADLVERVNHEIKQDHEISISFVDRQVAEQDPDLVRTKINLLPKFITELRLVKIGDIDIQADGGLHVRTTQEIGPVKLVKTENKGKGRKRITISTVDK